jgi:hypothetical protein
MVPNIATRRTAFTASARHQREQHDAEAEPECPVGRVQRCCPFLDQSSSAHAIARGDRVGFAIAVAGVHQLSTNSTIALNSFSIDRPPITVDGISRRGIST